MTMLLESRACRKCGIVKALTIENFQAIPNSTDGFRKTCKECKSASDRARYQKQREAILAHVKSWYEENKPHKKEYDRQHRLRNQAKIRATKRAYSRARRSKFPLQRLVENAYARGHGFDLNRRFKITRKDIASLLHRQNYSCIYCGDSLKEMTGIELDHIVPKIRGGHHSIGNLAASCTQCNREKSHRFIMEYRLRKVVQREAF